MIDKIRIKALRSIKDSGEVEIRPITVLVGKNSSGKSSFVRVFPLIKQTIETRTADPLLWYGELTDFADFNNASYKKRGNPVRITFQFTIKARYFNNGLNQRLPKTLSVRDVPIKISVSVFKHDFKEVVICYYDQEIRINNKTEKKKKRQYELLINGNNFYSKKLYITGQRQGNGLIPQLLVPAEALFPDDTGFKGDKLNISDYPSSPAFPSAQLVDSNIDKHQYLGGFNSVYSKKEVLSLFKKRSHNKYNDITVDSPEVIKYNEYIILSQLENLIDTINHQFRMEFHYTSYLKPIRANVERYYRIQGISIDEVNADGSNIPMILNNLSKEEKERFETWSEERFGFSFRANPTGGHISIIIPDHLMSGKNTNIADTGYGYSQILPIIWMLWNAENQTGKQGFRQRRIIIEQPELHLHPALQARLIRAFAAVITEARKNNIQINIIFETHSETMINELGRIVAEKELNENDVNVLAFSKNDYDDTVIQSCRYDEEGLLKNWPIGFFSTKM